MGVESRESGLAPFDSRHQFESSRVESWCYHIQSNALYCAVLCYSSRAQGHISMWRVRPNLNALRIGTCCIPAHVKTCHLGTEHFVYSYIYLRIRIRDRHV